MDTLLVTMKNLFEVIIQTDFIQSVKSIFIAIMEFDLIDFYNMVFMNTRCYLFFAIANTLLYTTNYFNGKIAKIAKESALNTVIFKSFQKDFLQVLLFGCVPVISTIFFILNLCLIDWEKIKFRTLAVFNYVHEFLVARNIIRYRVAENDIEQLLSMADEKIRIEDAMKEAYLKELEKQEAELKSQMNTCTSKVSIEQEQVEFVK